MTSPSSVARLSRCSIIPVARCLGLAVDEPRGRRPGVITCPSCRLHYGALIHRSHRRWCCLSCGARGDAFALVAYALGRAPYRELDRRAKRMVQHVCADIADRISKPVEVLRKRPRVGSEQEVA